MDPKDFQAKTLTIRGEVDDLSHHLALILNPKVVMDEHFDAAVSEIRGDKKPDTENREAIDTLRADPLTDMQRAVQDRRIKELQHLVETMEMYLDRSEAELRKAIEANGARIDDTQQRLDNLLESVRLNSERIDSQGARIVAQNIRANHHDEQIDQLDKRIDEHGHMIEQNATNIAKVKAFTGA